jgi:uncharacterized protein (DUF4213/DUF364 family)
VDTPPIRRWLVEAAQRIDAVVGPARVRRIVLPPLMEDPGKEGEFCAVQLDDGSVGLAFTLLDGTLAALHSQRRKAGPAMDLVQGYAAGNAAARALGLAAINALARLRPGDRLGMVGHFGSLIGQARALGIPVTVLELRPQLVHEEPGLVVTLDPRRLAGCNKIVSTSTLLLNDTFEQVSALWRGAEAVAMVGPSAGCPPDALFAAGVSTVGTAWVSDAEAFLAHVAAGRKWGAAARKVTLVARRYPGLEALLGGARRN